MGLRQSQLPLRKYFCPNKRSSENLKAKLHSLKMEHILDETVPAEDLKRFEQKYHEELQHGKVSSSSQFEYAWCLVRSRYPASKRLKKDGMVGMAVAGGAAVAFGGL